MHRLNTEAREGEARKTAHNGGQMFAKVQIHYAASTSQLSSIYETKIRIYLSLLWLSAIAGFSYLLRKVLSASMLIDFGLSIDKPKALDHTSCPTHPIAREQPNTTV